MRHARVVLDTFTVIAEPTRRRILDELRRADSTVGVLAQRLEVSQPAMSKHLRVLRDAGLVSSRVAAQARIYRIETAPLQELDGWLDPYRRLWTRHLDALERHLDRQEDSDGHRTVRSRTAGRRQRPPNR
jgi:DNA-binding transcriptional ArsR family regulator